ncbi:MAG: hypothetical protein ABI388_01885 [Bacteroidia bacterium]
MKTDSLLIVDKNLTAKDEIIRFYHFHQDLSKVCTLVDIFYDGNTIEDMYFFLEKQDLRNNTFELAIPKNKRSIRIIVKKVNPDYDLSNLMVDIF